MRAAPGPIKGHTSCKLKGRKPGGARSTAHGRVPCRAARRPYLAAIAAQAVLHQRVQRHALHAVVDGHAHAHLRGRGGRQEQPPKLKDGKVVLGITARCKGRQQRA